MVRHDITGDGRADIIVTSPWGLGVLAVSGGGITGTTLVGNGTRMGEWLLNTADNNVELRADLDGDGVAEVLMSSPWGIGAVKMIGGQLRSIAMGQNGRRFGGWIVDTTNNQFLLAGDITGDGRDDVLITSPWGLGLLTYANGAFGTAMLAPNGTRFGGWLLNTADNSFALLADVDGDGRQEIVVTSPWGLGVLKWDGAGLTSVVMAPNGTSFGGWTLDTTVDGIEVAGDFDGDRRSDLVIRNGAAVAVLRLDGANLRTTAVARSGDDLGGWRLDAQRDKLGIVGDFDGDGRAELVVTGDSGLAMVTVAGGAFRAAWTAANGTRFGGWLLNTRDNRLNYVADLDGDGRSELMISSPWGIGVLEQSGAGFSALTMAPNGSRFGGWLLNTADNDLEAGLGQSYGLLIWHHQWSDAVANTTTFLRNRGFTVVSTGDAQTGLTELRRLARTVRASDRYVYPDGYKMLTADEKGALSVSADAYLASMRADHDAYAPAIAALRGILGDTALVNRAADVYAAAYPLPWRTMFGDLGWNVDTEPVRLSPWKNGIEPRRYAGRDGFLRMIAEILGTLTGFSESYEEQERLLRQLNTEIFRNRIFNDRLVDQVITRIQPEPTDYLQYNAFDQVVQTRNLRVVEQVLQDQSVQAVQPAQPVEPDPGGRVRLVRRGGLQLRGHQLQGQQAVRLKGRRLDEERLVGADDRIQLQRPGALADVITSPLHHDLAAISRRIPIALLHPSVDDLVARINAIQVADAIVLDRLYYTLTIAEEAISRASAVGVETGDLVSF